VNQSGAAQFAGEGGVVVRLDRVGGWNVNALLEGRVKTVGEFKGNRASGESETAIVAAQPPSAVTALGVVTTSARGNPFVRNWLKVNSKEENK
jgi:hypothetical protein